MNRKKNSLGKLFWVFVALACLLVGLKCILKHSQSTVVDSGPSGPGGGVGSEVSVSISEPPPEDVENLRRQRQQELEKEKLLADIDKRHAKFKGDVEAICEKYRKMLPLSKAESCIGQAKAGADFIASREGLCGFKVCAVLAYKMAWDKLKKTSRTEEAIVPVVEERIVNPLTDAVSAYSDWTASFGQELRAEELAFAADLALRSEQFNESMIVLEDDDAKHLGESVCKMVSDIKDHAREAAFAEVETAIEVALIHSSYAAIKKVVLRCATTSLAGIAAKMGGTVATAGTSAVADGPLPIGDIVGGVITVGGMAWTAYDIYKVTKKMPSEMKSRILAAIEEANASLRKTAEGNLDTRCNVVKKWADGNVEKLHQMVQ